MLDEFMRKEVGYDDLMHIMEKKTMWS